MSCAIALKNGNTAGTLRRFGNANSLIVSTVQTWHICRQRCGYVFSVDVALQIRDSDKNCLDKWIGIRYPLSKTCISCMLLGKEGIMDNKFWDIIFRWMDRIENRLAVIEQDVKELIENKGKLEGHSEASSKNRSLWTLVLSLIGAISGLIALIVSLKNC